MVRYPAAVPLIYFSGGSIRWLKMACWYVDMQEGYAASRSHVESNAIKTNCSLGRCVQIAQLMARQTAAT
jgi:hypothetical protein